MNSWSRNKRVIEAVIRKCAAEKTPARIHKTLTASLGALQRKKVVDRFAIEFKKAPKFGVVICVWAFSGKRALMATVTGDW